MVAAGLAAAIVAATGVAGCASSSGGSHRSASVPPAAGMVQVGRLEPLHHGSVTAAEVAADQTAFGFALFDRLCAASPKNNVTLSPASAALALGMLDAGAGGATQAAVGRLLHLPAWSPALVAALHDQGEALGAVPQVTVANHVFEQPGLTPAQHVLDDLRTAFNAGLRPIDFSQEPQATNAINAVISQDTHGMIPALFGEPLPGSTQTVLANAVVLDAKWRQPFPSAAKGTFHAASGSPVQAQMMSNPDGSFASRAVDGWTSAVLPYVGNLQAVAILPPAGVPACATPSLQQLSALTGGSAEPAAVVLPKLDLAQTLPLTQTLSAMGLPLSGDYSGLGAGDSAISQVVQKVVMKVDQSGTKAAAATGIAIASSARVGGSTLTFDRPFFLLLEDTATHTPLFLTRVADPTQQ